MDKFTVFYTDGTQFSGEPFKRDWSKIDSTKQIIKLEYMLGNACIIMEGYKQYNHLIEHIAIAGKKDRIEKIYLMGRTDGDTEIIILALREGKIYKQSKPCYQEYGKQLLAGWQKGKLDNPKSTFKQIK